MTCRRVDLPAACRNLFRLAASCIALAFGGAACSSSSALSGATAFTPNTQLAGYSQPLDDGGPDPSVVFITMAKVDQGAETCAELLPGGHPPVVRGDALEIFVTTGDGTAVGTGSYDFVFPPGPAMGSRGAFLLRIDLDGGATIGAGASGSIVLTSATETVAGTFNTVLEDADGGSLGALSGTFSAPNCGPLYVF